MQVPGRKIFRDEEFYTDWMPRGGDGFILRSQQIVSTPSTGMDVLIEVQTKNIEDTTNPTTSLISAQTLEAAVVTLKRSAFTPPTGSGTTGVKELVRLKVYTANGTAGDWMLCRTFPLVWFDGVR